MNASPAGHDKRVVIALGGNAAYPPTIRGTAKGIGVSTARAKQLLDALVAEGIVGHVPGAARTFTVNRTAASRYLAGPEVIHA